MENKIKIKKKKIYIYIYKSLQLPRGPGVAEAAHSALDASIYRHFPVLGLASIIALWIPKIMAQIGRFATTYFYISR